MHPTKLERVGDTALRIHWSDGQVREYTVANLRDAARARRAERSVRRRRLRHRN